MSVWSEMVSVSFVCYEHSIGHSGSLRKVFKIKKMKSCLGAKGQNVPWFDTQNVRHLTPITSVWIQMSTFECNPMFEKTTATNNSAKNGHPLPVPETWHVDSFGSSLKTFVTVLSNNTPIQIILVFFERRLSKLVVHFNFCFWIEIMFVLSSNLCFLWNVVGGFRFVFVALLKVNVKGP